MAEETWDKLVPDATDRCDRCRSQAYIIARAYGTLFRWCSHHWRVDVRLRDSRGRGRRHKGINPLYVLSYTRPGVWFRVHPAR